MIRHDQISIQTIADELANLLAPFESGLAAHGLRRHKLILHVGTPKTGTTSLQTYFEKRQRKLRSKGILYPHNIRQLNSPSAPKHQWIEKNLVTTHVDFFLENIKNVIAQIKDDTHTVILSSEGIYNYWWDFPDESKALLGVMGKLFDVQLWAWFREPLSFIESYYKQCIRNPAVDSNPCYGTSLTFAEMLDIPWFAKHLDYQGFVAECEAIFGEHSVSAFEYQGDVVQQVINKLGLHTPHDNPTPRQNNSLNAATVELMRILNRYPMTAKDKERLIPHLKQMNPILQGYSEPSLIDDVSKERVLTLSQRIPSD
ncbi:MAG: sulfotransferase family protein [Pseudomonadota bacterium]